MKKSLMTVAMLLIAAMLFAAFNPAYSDYQFYNLGEYDVDWDYLEGALATAKDDNEKAEILWRMSRTRLTITDGIPEESSYKKARLEGYAEAEAYADQALALVESADAYHWKSSAIGRTGQVNGPLNSLSKAKPMLQLIEKAQNDFNADLSDSWYVLGVLYKSLPGAPISFGNSTYAISYMKRCLDTQDTLNRTNLTNYLETAEQLYDRNWNADKRAKEFDKMANNYSKNSVPTEKMKFYEGKDGRNTMGYYCSVPLATISDRQEAVTLIRYALAVYDARKAAGVTLASDDEKAAELQAWLNERT